MIEIIGVSILSYATMDIRLIYMDFLIVFAAKYLIGVPVVVLLGYFIFSKGKTLRQLLWLSAVSLPLSFLLSRIAGLFYNDPRPFVVGHFTPLINHVADNGFPSDHTLFAATLAMLILYVDKRVGAFLWIVTLIIGISRVYAGVHHLVDIVGSILIAVVAVLISQYLITTFRRK